MQYMAFTETLVKWSVSLTNRFDPEILTMLFLTMLEIKGQVLYCVRVLMKLLGWLSDLNALQTRKLPMLLSRLNETNGGRGNIRSVLGSLRRILKF